ncbi:RimJ/RimL family protein N-acetyltransferase [Actinokineospora auranticolor]|uniref:RimJ/RimL family protein N-acetyltransferase n=2 Tax=Actinokineospora auranticolor TaxID=155976 RepID=A0A2S6GHZ8_9PSEU|nr:RimJ/RimL family protein N-acetyltransferase [Actinokineospora auranticolor]
MNDPGTPDLRAIGPRGNDLVTLRPWRVDDLPVIAEAGRDPYIPLITTIPRDYTPEGGHAWLRRQHDQATDGRGCPLAISAGDEAVGMVTINSIDWHDRRGSIGYWVLDRHRGRGYAKSAVSLLPELARDLGLVRLQALVEPDNAASQATCRALGFTAEGVLRGYHRIGGTNRDMIMFGLLVGPQ